MGGYTQAAYLRCILVDLQDLPTDLEMRGSSRRVRIEIYFSATRWKDPGISTCCSFPFNVVKDYLPGASEPCSWLQRTAIPVRLPLKVVATAARLKGLK